MAYTVVLVLHNLWRWLVVLAAIYATARAWFGWLGKRPWTKADQRAGTLFGISLDIQLLLGLILAIISPLMQAAYQDLGYQKGRFPVTESYAEQILSLPMYAELPAHLLESYGRVETAGWIEIPLWELGGMI